MQLVNSSPFEAGEVGILTSAFNVGADIDRFSFHIAGCSVSQPVNSSPFEVDEVRILTAALIV